MPLYRKYVRLQFETQAIGRNAGDAFGLDHRLFRAVKGDDARPFHAGQVQRERRVRRGQFGMRAEEILELRAEIAHGP